MEDCRRRRSFQRDGFRSKSRMALKELGRRSFLLTKSQSYLMGGASLTGIYSSQSLSPEHVPPPRYTLLSDSHRRTIYGEVLGEAEEEDDAEGKKIRADRAKRASLGLSLQPLAEAAVAAVAGTKASAKTGKEKRRKSDVFERGNHEGEDAGDQGKKCEKLNFPPATAVAKWGKMKKWLRSWQPDPNRRWPIQGW